jgi:serine/threonine protein kinase
MFFTIDNYFYISLCIVYLITENVIYEFQHLNYALNEIKKLNRLDHERIVKFFGFYLDQTQIIIFMEAINSSVKDEIKDKCLTEFEAMDYFTQAAEGLAYLHSRKPKAIVHRDIKCCSLFCRKALN